MATEIYLQEGSHKRIIIGFNREQIWYQKLLFILRNQQCSSYYQTRTCVYGEKKVAQTFATTQLAIFRIEYNAFSKAKFGNFQKLLKLNIYLQTIIIGEKTQFELNLTSFK